MNLEQYSKNHKRSIRKVITKIHNNSEDFQYFVELQKKFQLESEKIFASTKQDKLFEQYKNTLLKAIDVILATECIDKKKKLVKKNVS